MSTINAVPFRSTIFYTAAGVPAATGSVLTIGDNGVSGFTRNLGSTMVSIGASTNQTYNNFTSGSYTTWATSKSAITSANKTVQSANGLYQLVVANTTSNLSLSSDSGITWSTLSGGLPTLTGSAYWSDGAISANGQYITLSMYGGSPWMSADYGRTFALTNQPTPSIWLPLNGSVADSMGLSVVTTPGTVPGYVTLNYPGYTAQAVNLANTAGGTATRYIRGTWAGASNFTVSGWVNPQTLNSTYQGIFSAYTGKIAISISDINTLYATIPTGGGTNFTSLGFYTLTLSVNTWYYFTLIFQTNGLCSFYVNNNLIASATNIGGVGSFTTTQFSLGTYDSAIELSFNGYFDDLRITNSVSTYVPIPLLQPNIWLPFENSTADLGSNAITPTVTGSVSYVPGVVGLNAVNLVNPPGGTPANYISGSWPALTVCTVSGWFNIQSFSTSSNQFVCSLAAATGSIIIFIEYTSRKLYAQLGLNQASIGNALSLNTWYYFQLIVSSSSSATLYLNSDSVTFAYTAGGSAGGGFSVGTYSGGGYAFNGYIDDLRIYNAAIPYHVLFPQNYRSLALSGTGQYALASAASGWVVGSSDSSKTWSKQAVCVGTQSDLIQPQLTGLGASTWAANGVNWVASSSSNLGAAFVAYYVFNGTSASSGFNYASASAYNTANGAYTGSNSTTVVGITPAVTGEWLQIQSSIPLVLTSYTYGSANWLGLPKTGYWVGSNDGTTWYPLQSWSMTTNPLTSAWAACSTYLTMNYTGTQTIIGNVVGSGTFTSYSYTIQAYQYFRMIGQTIYAGNMYYEMSELYLNFTRSVPTLHPSALSMNHTGQYQLIATGPAAGSVMPNQSGLVASTWSQGGVNWTVSASSILDANHIASNVFNNNISGATVNRWASPVIYTSGTGAYAGSVSTTIQGIGSPVLGEWIQLSSSVPLVFSSYAVSCGGTIATFPKIYYLIGSNDGSTWFPLQFANITTTPFTTTFSVSSNSLQVNVTGIQTLTAGQAGSVTTTSYATSTQAYMYFRMVITHINVGSTLAEVNEIYINFSNSVSYSSNYGSTWLNTSSTVSNESVALSSSGQYALSTNSVAPFARLTLDNTNVDAQGVLAPTTGAGTVTYSTSIKAVGTHSAFFNQTAGSTTPTMYLNYIVPTVLNTPSVMTMSCWMYMTALPASGISIPMSFSNVGNTVGGVSFFIGTSGSYMRFAYTATISGYAELNYSPSVLTNSWYHLVAVASGGITQFYVNGTLISSGTYSGLLCLTGSANMSRLMVGAQYTSGTYAGAFNGYIDDVRLYTSALNAHEVAALYNNPALTQTIAVSSSYLPITSYTKPILPGITANIVDTAVSQTGQYMVAVTSSTTNNVYYSTDFGATFTALTVGSSAMVSCSISYDGSYLTVENATTLYTLNRNTQGFTVAVGNQTGLINQAQNAIAIGNQAGRTNQSANSIVLNATGAALDAVVPGFYVAPVASAASSSAAPFNLLGYGTDNQIVQSSALTVLQNGNMGIGTANSSTPLTIYSSGFGTAFLSIYGPGSAGNTAGINISPWGGTLRPGGTTTTIWALDDGLYSAHLLFGTAATGSPGSSTVTERMRITSSGLVGIGCTNPMYKTQIVLASNSDPGNSNLFGLTTADSGVQSQRLYMGLVDNGGTGSNSYSWISASRYGYGYNSLALQPAGGNVGIGITNPVVPLHVGTFVWTNMTAGSWTASIYNQALYGPSNTNQNISAYFVNYASSGNGFITYSDKRIKKDIEPATNCLDAVLQLQPVTYRKKNVMEDGNELHTGFIAQDVQEIYPSAIHKRTDTIPSIYEIRHASLVENGIQLTESIDVPLDARVVVIDFRNKKIQMIHRPDNVLLFEEQSDTIELDGDKVFIFGHEVSDKLMLNHDSLFAVGMGAIKELAQKHEALAASYATLQARMDALEARLAS